MKSLIILALLYSQSILAKEEKQKFLVFKRCHELFFKLPVMATKEGRKALESLKDNRISDRAACKTLISNSFKVTKHKSSFDFIVNNKAIFNNLLSLFSSRFLNNYQTESKVAPDDEKFYFFHELSVLMTFFMISEDHNLRSILSDYWYISNSSATRNGQLIYKIKNKPTAKEDRNHFGGGFLGHDLYLTLNFGFGFNKNQTGTELPRRLSVSMLNDFLCKTLPVLTVDDVKGYLKPKSEVPYQQKSQCMVCHVTMDPLLGAVRNLKKVTRASTNGLLKTSFINQSISDSKQEQDFFYDNPSYGKSKPIGKLTYRNQAGVLVDESFYKLKEAGETILRQEDFYTCSLSNFYKSIYPDKTAMAKRSFKKTLRKMNDKNNIWEMIILSIEEGLI